jgi:hypothetical protein
MGKHVGNHNGHMNTTAHHSPSSVEALLPLNGVALLSQLGVIRVEGEDAAKFLHGQLTQDFSLLGQDHARLAAFCSAKGRMQASFIGFKRSSTDILLVCSRDVLAATLKRLSMFVLRAKAKLSDATDAFAVYGLTGNPVTSAEQSDWAATRDGEATLINLYPALGVTRQMWVAPQGTTPPKGEPLSLDTWLWGEVRSGVATLSQPVFEAFVPQMLNYESVGGVNFKKGCYPGQEVVARSQFRGTLKRRAALAHCESAMTAGQELFGSEDDSQPVGLVVQAAANPQGGWDAIVSLQLTALAAGGLRLQSPGGAVLQPLPLPYELMEDI